MSSAPAGDQAAAPKKKGKLLIIVALVVALAGGGGAWFMLKGKPKKGEHAEKKEKTHAPPTFVELDTFTVNLQPHSEGQFLQTALVAKLTDAHVADLVKANLPEIKNRVLMLLSSKSAQDLSSQKGKEQLGKAITVQLKSALGDKEKAQAVAGVLFTSFVIQ